MELQKAPRERGFLFVLRLRQSVHRLGYNAGWRSLTKDRSMPTEFLLVSIARALVEVAGMLMLGQGLLWIFGPKARDGNFIYDLFKKGTGPIIKATRIITPRFVHDSHVGLVAFMLLLWVWLGLGYAKRYLCVTQQLACT